MARQRPVSPQAAELVFRLCEQEPAEIVWHVLDMHFARSGEELLRAGALVETTPSDTIIMPVDIDDELVEFDWDPDRQAYVGFHPNMGIVEADPRARKRYRIDFDWLLGLIARDLAMPTTSPVALKSDLVWELGRAWAGRRRATVLFARRLGYPETFDRICDVLLHRAAGRSGVVLTTSPNLSRHATIPAHRILPLARPQPSRPDAPLIDPEAIAAGLDIPSSRGSEPVRASADFSTIMVDDRLFHFRGSKQRQVVGYLYEAWKVGQPRVSVSMMWTDLDFSDGTRLRDLFKGHADWQDLIAQEQGLCWLKI